MDQLKQKFNELTEREKILVGISALFVVIALFYFILWQPLNQALTANRQAVEDNRSELTWVQRNANRAVQLRGGSNSSVAFTGSLPQAVNQTASRLRIAISRMQPQGEELKVWVDEAPFNDVMSWLQSMESKGIRIINLDLVQADTPGTVKVRSLQLGKS